MLIAKGAEAELSREDGVVIKERIKKSYRIQELDDKLRKRRTALEARLLREAGVANCADGQVRRISSERRAKEPGGTL